MILLTPLIITLHPQLKLQKKTKYSHENLSDYLLNESGSTVFLQPTDREEIANIISSLSSNKASAPNSILIKYYFF